MVDAWMAFGKAYLLTQAKQLGRRFSREVVVGFSKEKMNRSSLA